MPAVPGKVGAARDPEGRPLNPSLPLFGSLLVVSLIGTRRFMIKIKPTG